MTHAQIRDRRLGVCTRSVDFATETHSDGRTLEGYGAVFGVPALIRSWDGDFEEVIHPGAFMRSLALRTPVLQYDHGRDVRIGTCPIGAIEELREDPQGLYVRARLFDHPDVERVRQAIAGKALRGMSFRFEVAEGGETWTPRAGQPDLREIRDMDIHELGPVVFPAYDTTSVSVRSLLTQLDPEQHRALIREVAAEVRRLDADPTDLTGEPGARGAGRGDPERAGPDSGGSSTPSPELLRLEAEAIRALGGL